MNLSKTEKRFLEEFGDIGEVETADGRKFVNAAFSLAEKGAIRITNSSVEFVSRGVQCHVKQTGASVEIVEFEVTNA